MEGGPVFDKQGFLVGILTRPLRQKGSTAEIQLVISWDAITTAERIGLEKEAQRAQSELIDKDVKRVHKASLHSINEWRKFAEDLPWCPDLSLSRSFLEKAICSIVLVTVGDGAWASGIILNKHGLILTNAHILEPWRFGRTSLLGPVDKNSTSYFEHESFVSEQEEHNDKEEGGILFPTQLGSLEDSLTSGRKATFLNSNYESHKRISVRLHCMDKQIWYGARAVFVSKGPWDVALLQIESSADQLCPMTPEFVCPAIGSAIHVIGHGLLGPRSGISPSVSSGVLANIVRIPEPSMASGESRDVPIMVQTTAAVHPGASGGAVVGTDGRLIGLVTSNARHSGGNIIPYLNFSIPCLALEPIFKFSDLPPDKQDFSTLQALDHPNELLSSIWALIPPPAPKLLTSEKNDREVKGSRFSQFLAEQRKNQMHPGTHKFPSKI